MWAECNYKGALTKYGDGTQINEWQTDTETWKKLTKSWSFKETDAWETHLPVNNKHYNTN